MTEQLRGSSWLTGNEEWGEMSAQSWSERKDTPRSASARINFPDREFISSVSAQIVAHTPQLGLDWRQAHTNVHLCFPSSPSALVQMDRGLQLFHSWSSPWSKRNFPVVIPVNDQHALVQLKLSCSSTFITDWDRDRFTASLVFLLCCSDLLTETFIPFIHLLFLWGLSQRGKSLNREPFSLALQFWQVFLRSAETCCCHIATVGWGLLPDVVLNWLFLMFGVKALLSVALQWLS